jgi:hypothetical protein
LLLYVEFISRRPGVTLADFQLHAGNAQTTWASDYGADQIVLNVGRTWRVGPDPEYMCAWYSPEHGLERIDEWETVFRSGGHDAVHAEFESVARIDRAGCYTTLFPATPGSRGRYCVEWFELVPGASEAQLRDHFEQRARDHGNLDLNVVALPIGAMAPGSLGFAAWGLPDFAAAHVLAGAGREAPSLMRVVDMSLMADLGEEQL